MVLHTWYDTSEAERRNLRFVIYAEHPNHCWQCYLMVKLLRKHGINIAYQAMRRVDEPVKTFELVIIEKDNNKPKISALYRGLIGEHAFNTLNTFVPGIKLRVITEILKGVRTELLSMEKIKEREE